MTNAVLTMIAKERVANANGQKLNVLEEFIDENNKRHRSRRR